MKNLIIIFSLFIFQSSFSQTKEDWNLITTGRFMYELKTSPFVSLYRLNYFLDSDGEKTSISDILKKQNIDLENSKYAQIKFKGNNYFATKKNENSDVRLFKLLKETPDFFVVCSDEKELCDCKASTFLYFKSSKKLQRIEKPFSFSLKNNLVDRLQTHNLPVKEEYEKLNFCEILNTL